MFKWICFDWGDTLADVHGAVAELQRDQDMQKVLESFGVKVTPAEFDEAYNFIAKEFSISMRGNVQRWQKGLFLHKLCERLNFPITEDEAARMSDVYNKQFISKLKLLPGAKEVVEFLAAKDIGLALISNANGERIRRQLEFFGLRNYFSIIIISDELGFEKSSVEPFRTFLALATTVTPGLKPEECLMIGDRADEDCFAKEAGMKVAIVKRQHRAYEEGLKPDYWVSDLHELKQLLQNILVDVNGTK